MTRSIGMLTIVPIHDPSALILFPVSFLIRRDSLC